MNMFNVGYVCGVLCSDGFFSWDEAHGNYRFGMETKEKEFAGLFFNRLKNVVNKKPSFYQRKKKYKDKEYLTHIVSLYSKDIVGGFVSRWKLEMGTYSWRTPLIVFLDQEARRGFLQGFFDGDGTIRLRLRVHKDGRKSKCRSLRVMSVNLKGLKQLKQLLKLESIDCMIYPTGKYFVLDIDGKNRVAKFVKNINFGIPRKKNKIELSLDPTTFEEAMKL